MAALTLAACGSSGTKTVVVTVPPTSGSATTTPATTTPATTTPTTTTPTTTPVGTTATTSTPTTTTTPTTTPNVTATGHLKTFRSPSGNIGCQMLDNEARCDISMRSWTPSARPASCPTVVDFGQGLSVGGSGRGRFVCAGDTARDPTSAPLAYGATAVLGKITCASAFTGITCTNRADGHGFFISRQSYRIF